MTKKKLPRNIREIGNKFWVSKMIGKERFHKGFRTVAEAVAYRNELETQAAQAKLMPRQPSKSVAFWLQDSLNWATAEKAISTYKNYEYALNNLGRFLADRNIIWLNDITLRLFSAAWLVEKRRSAQR